VLDSPPRRDLRSDPAVASGSGRGVPASASTPPPAGQAPAARTWPRRWATVALTVLTALQLLGTLGYLLVITTVPAKVDLSAGPRPALVGPQAAAPPVADAPQAGPPAVAPTVRATDLFIPKLKLRQALIELGVDGAGVLQPPSSPKLAGWFPGAAAPGEVGPTVIAGHVDSKDGPGVFYRLKDLAPGDLVDVGRSDGTTARYRVTEVFTVEKDQFPTQKVYGQTPGSELRLITCGGTFDRVAGHYLRNVVVSGVLVDPS
jgi:LPXTG-site transpeptidase (sortase) family protein